MKEALEDEQPRRSEVPLEALTPPPWLRDDSAPPAASPAAAHALCQRVRQLIRQRHYSFRTEKSYLGWVRRFLAFHRYEDASRLGADEVRAYLSHLAIRQRISASTQNQAFSALLFLFREVLGRKLERLDDTPRAKSPVRLPVILARREVQAILGRLRGRTWLIASLMYGSGLRLGECLGLRIKDMDFDRRVLVVRDGKGGKDRETVFPRKLVEPLRRRLEHVRRRHENALADGRGAVTLPDALERKYPRATWELGWQWVFPATREYVDTRTGILRRHHLHQTVVQRSFKSAVREAGVTKPATTHSLRHCAGSRIMPGSGFRACPTWLSA